MGFLDTVLNLDVALMTTQSRIWAANEEWKAERKYNNYVKNHSEKEEESKEEEKPADVEAQKTEVKEAEKQMHPEDDKPEVIKVEVPEEEKVVEAVEPVVTPVVSEQPKEEVQHGPDFSNLQNVEVPLVRGVNYEASGYNPALHQLNQNPDLAVETVMNTIISENSALQNLDKTALNAIVKSFIESALIEIRKKNPGLQHIDSEMLNTTLKEFAKNIQQVQASA